MSGNPNIPRLLLDYILTARGICHENALILALMRLKIDFKEFNSSWSIQEWTSELNENIDQINIRLNTLNYKIVKLSHGMGKNAVTLKNKQNFRLLEPTSTTNNQEEANNEDDVSNNNSAGNSPNSNNNNNNNPRMNVVLPESNKFYVYINMESTEETKLATKFQEKEISFIKWAIDQFTNHATVIESTSNGEIGSNIIFKEINKLLNTLSHQVSDLEDSGNIEGIQEAVRNRSEIVWNQFISFTARSTKLLQYEEMGAMETETLLLQLCELKWFYRDSNGRFGMDLRCLAELQDFLINEYELPTCQYCHQLTLQGVMCGNSDCHNSDTDSKNPIFQRHVWHLDCFNHYMIHVSQKCDNCHNSLLRNGIYII